MTTICARCGEEVRYGKRADITGWLHREAVDHLPILGQPFTPELRARAEAARHVVYHKDDGTPYTPAGQDALKIKDEAKRRAALEALPTTAPERLEPGESALEPIEVYCTDLPRQKMTLPRGCIGPTGGVPNGTRAVMNAGWEVTRLTYSRGPYMGLDGKSLGISEFVVLHVREPDVDDHPRMGVASWRDGKADTAYLVRKGHAEPLSVSELKTLIKEATSA